MYRLNLGILKALQGGGIQVAARRIEVRVVSS